MPFLKNNLISTTFGCNCQKLNLSKVFHPKPIKQKRHHHHHSSVSSSTSSKTTPTNTSTLSPTTSDTTTPVIINSRAVQGFGWLGGNSLAVEKDSSDPFADFKDSMLQMIMEKEIYRKDDLQELLNCFLQLNSPYYHQIIVAAFTEIWGTLLN